VLFNLTHLGLVNNANLFLGMTSSWEHNCYHLLVVK
jgi:hypothetical protein